MSRFSIYSHRRVAVLYLGRLSHCPTGAFRSSRRQTGHPVQAGVSGCRIHRPVAFRREFLQPCSSAGGRYPQTPPGSPSLMSQPCHGTEMRGLASPPGKARGSSPSPLLARAHANLPAGSRRRGFTSRGVRALTYLFVWACVNASK